MSGCVGRVGKWLVRKLGGCVSGCVVGGVCEWFGRGLGGCVRGVLVEECVNGLVVGLVAVGGVCWWKSV